MFYKCRTVEETKKLFRELAMYLHPDKGGDARLMTLLNDAFEYKKEILKVVEDKIKEDEKIKKKYESRTNGKYEMAYEDLYQDSDDEALNIISDIFKYAETHKRFNTDFVESINDFLEINGYITSSQYNKLVNIYYSFRMDKEEKE